ncbi:hypothetical protein BRC96_09110 [Halobacteriales archaeon QS_6_64_34]|nr:MAG: hypothetical protein BRC96_09110 [Halobacteriales archaeon QS_6_64_34]
MLVGTKRINYANIPQVRYQAVRCGNPVVGLSGRAHTASADVEDSSDRAPAESLCVGGRDSDSPRAPAGRPPTERDRGEFTVWTDDPAAFATALPTVLSEAEKGTLRILLSKPARRWELYLGTFLTIVSYAVLVGLASLFVLGSMLYLMADVGAAAIGVGIFSSIPGALAFGAFGAVVVTSVGLAVAVTTKDRLRTALGGLVIPALFFVFIPARMFADDIYEDYALYLVDVSYHFGHAFVFLYETIGIGLSPRSQQLLILSGVYERPTGRGHLPESVPTTGHLPMELSVALLAGIAVVALAVGVVRFRRIDV